MRRTQQRRQHAASIPSSSLVVHRLRRVFVRCLKRTRSVLADGILAHTAAISLAAIGVIPSRVCVSSAAASINVGNSCSTLGIFACEL